MLYTFLYFTFKDCELVGRIQGQSTIGKYLGVGGQVDNSLTETVLYTGKRVCDAP
jgi:hypothetical protein